jgi:hypothetical protein
MYVHEKDLVAVLELLSNFTLSYTVLIGDVQSAVENENPRQSRAGGFQYNQYNTLSQVLRNLELRVISLHC